MAKRADPDVLSEAGVAQRQLRADFYRREETPARRVANDRLWELGEKVGAHTPSEEEVLEQLAEDEVD